MFFDFILKPFFEKGKLQKTRASAMQMAIMSTVILGTGGYFISTTTDSALKSSKSFIAKSSQRSLGSALYMASRSSVALEVSAKNSNSELSRCMYDLSSCKKLSGNFPLYSSSGKRLSGDYNRFGHNCSDSAVKKDNPHCSETVLKVGNLFYEIVEDETYYKVYDKAKGKNFESRKFMVAYTSRGANNKKMERYHLSSVGNHKSKLKDPDARDGIYFEFTGIGGQKACPKGQSINEIVKGEINCSVVDYTGPRGAAGPQGLRGRDGQIGNRYQDRNSGCFDPYTKVKISTGEFKQIKDILLSDKIYNPMTGKSVAIKSIVRGPELLPMLKLQTSAFDIEVTHGHAMVVKNEKNNAISIVMAKDVKAGDLVQTKNGFEKLLGVEKVFKGPDYLVYNLNLAGDDVTTKHLIQAEGFVTGDLHLQIKLDKKGKMNNVSLNVNE